MRDDLLIYYERELDYLRKMAVQFAEKHPKVASRLVLEPTKCEDPHVERLLEAFAFLAARVHLKIDDDFPEISEALLTVIYPQLVRPIPSMSIVEFQLDPEKGKLTTSLPIPRNSALYSRPVAGVPCRFKTCYDVALWPVSVVDAAWRSPSRLQPAVKAGDATGAIRIELGCAPDVNLKDLKIDRLRFFLDGDSGWINTLYEFMFTKLDRIIVRDPTPASTVPPVTLPASSLHAVGFAEEEGMMPFEHRSFVGHRLLMEYFSFPEKFFFIDLVDLPSIWDAGFKGRAELVFLFSGVDEDDRLQRLQSEIKSKTFRLGCTPIVNLFPQIAEPIQVNQRRYEYPVIPDVRRPFSVEIFSIDEVRSLDTVSQQSTTFIPFYSLRHSARTAKQSSYWLARRRPSERPNDEGTDMYLSLVDLSLRATSAPETILSVRTTCTNRDLPTRLPFGVEEGDFELEGSSSLKRIVTLRKPTQPVRPTIGKSALWRLISHLSLNYLSLVDEGKEALQQILRLYDIGRTAYSQNVIDGIQEVKSKRHFTRVSTKDGIAFARGTRVEIALDESQFVGGGVYLFACILERFLGLSVSLNSFTQLVVSTSQRKEVLQEWQPRAGRKILV